MTVAELLAILARYNKESCGDWEVHVSILDGRDREYGEAVTTAAQPDLARGKGHFLVMGKKLQEVSYDRNYVKDRMTPEEVMAAEPDDLLGCAECDVPAGTPCKPDCGAM